MKHQAAAESNSSINSQLRLPFLQPIKQSCISTKFLYWHFNLCHLKLLVNPNIDLTLVLGDNFILSLGLQEGE